jgi:uncharacterized membrane protein
VSNQFKAAAARAVGGALLAFCLTFLGTFQVTEPENPRRMEITIVAAASAAFTYLASRGVAEGWYDTHRQQTGQIRASDVGALPPPNTGGE